MIEEMDKRVKCWAEKTRRKLKYHQWRGDKEDFETHFKETNADPSELKITYPSDDCDLIGSEDCKFCDYRDFCDEIV